MYRNLLLAFTILFLMPIVALAQDGKVRGLVKDKESGEPLIGANVLVEGTNIGAATDVNGEYIILSIPPGVYTLRASLIGYAPLTVSNIRISSNLTTTQDFELLSTAVQVTGVEVVAERPLIQRNTTNTIRLTTQEDIQNLPFRGVQNILSLAAGVIQQDGNLYVRGGRSGEVAYFIDGANVTNPITNTNNVSIIQESIEELQLQAGGYTAEFGGSNSGIARTSIRTGGSDFKGSLDIRSDDFAKPGEEFLGTSSFGFRNAVLTVSGPVTSDLRFFVAGQHNYIRSRQVNFIEPFRFDSLRVDRGDSRFNPNLPANQQALLPGPVEYRRNYLPKSWSETNTVQGTLLYDIAPVKFRLTGSYEALQQPLDGTWPNALTYYFNLKRARMDHQNNIFGSLRASHVLGASTFYEVAVSYQNRSFRREDPDFKDDWKSYVDSSANAALGYTGFPRRYTHPDDMRYSTINAFYFRHENAPNNNYMKNRQSSISFAGDVTSQLEKTWELKAGGRVELWTARHYAVGNIQNAMNALFNPDGTPRSFANAEERRATLAHGTRGGSINFYGYDVDGNEVSDGIDAPRKPTFISGYVQNKFEYQDLVLNIGLRYERFDTKNKTFRDPLNPDFDESLDIIDESKLVEASPFELVLPRISFSFPVTSTTVFYAMYGKYAQMPSLNQLYFGNVLLSRTVSEITRGNAFLTPVGFLMRPERTTQYEMGFRQSLTENFAFTVTGFYKDLKDQLQVRNFVSPSGTKLFTAYLNEDFGTVKGVELTLELRRTNRFSARFNYTLSDALGTGSNSQSAFGAIEQNIGRPTNFINPLTFNQTHRGSFLMDFRFAKDDGGPVLEGLGVGAVITFNSGHNYTKINEPSELGQASPWNVGIRPLIDPRSSFPAEPLNSSKTPWVFNVDLNIVKTFYLGSVNLSVYADLINVFNTKQIINVYPSTGTAQDDGWLNSPLAGQFAEIPNYVAFYNAINLQNRWAYALATGNDLFGSPRQIRFGLRAEI
jgi:hypothetical protein